MENKMTEEQAQAANREPMVEGQKNSAVTPLKKKASWLRTILWMLSMMLLVNVVMAIIAYVLYSYKII